MNGEATAKATVDSDTVGAAARPTGGPGAPGTAGWTKGRERGRGGLNWDALRQGHEERLLWEKDQGLEPIELLLAAEATESKLKGQDAAPKKTLKRKPQPGFGGSSARYDRDLIVRLYKDGKTVPQIAEEVGCNKQTVYSALKAANVTLRDDRKTLAGRPRQKMCGAGLHEMKGDNVRIDKGKDGKERRSCKKCANAKAKVRNQKARANRKKNESGSITLLKKRK